MQDYKIGAFTLTTGHPASHDGIPALVDEAGKVYGPAAPITTPETAAGFGPEPHPAALIVAAAAKAETVPADVREGMRRYCAQWVEGPQVEG
jgi:hypothetical protein